MRTLIHRFLLWAPAAIVGAALAAAGVWDGVKEILASQAAIMWSAMAEPLVATISIVVIAGYVALAVWTGGDKTSAVKPRKLFVQTGEPWCESFYVKLDTGEATPFYLNRFYLTVFNDVPSGDTIEDVSVFLRLFRPPEPCPIWSTDGAVSGRIRHGEQLLFCLGEMLADKPASFVSGGIILREPELHNVRNGLASFSYPGLASRSMLGNTPGHTWELVASVTGKGVVSQTVWVDIHMSDSPRPVKLRLPTATQKWWRKPMPQSIRKLWASIATKR